MKRGAGGEGPAPPAFLEDSLLGTRGILHGFGQRGGRAPDPTAFPRQVHGRTVVPAADWSEAERPAADAVLATPGCRRVGIVTADCVPILACSEDGAAAAAIHAGWRGLAAGVVEAGIEQLAQAAPGRLLLAAIGPAARVCCYEVDAPVLDALSDRYPEAMAEPGLSVATRPGHARIDLPRLVRAALERSGVISTRIGLAGAACTVCNPGRFESYRRDGAAAGRLSHYIEARIEAAAPLSREG